MDETIANLRRGDLLVIETDDEAPGDEYRWSPADK
jgi:hypothetical protein